MRTIALALLLAGAQDPAADARKLLDALVPEAKDSPYVQLEWEVQPGPSTLVGHFRRGEKWRTDANLPGGKQITVYDGKTVVVHTMTDRVPNHVDRYPAEPSTMLTTIGGALAEILYRGNAERFLKGASEVKVGKEKLGNVDCTRVTVRKPERNRDYEHSVWIDGKNRCVRYVRKVQLPDRMSELIYTYKPLAKPTTQEALFDYQPPAK